MEEETPRPRKDNAYNRRNLFIDGVSGPVKPRPHPGTHLTPQADSAPKPIETKASVEDSISPKSSSGEDTSRPEPSSSQVKTSGNETPSLIGSTLPSKGLSRNKKPPFSRRKSRVRRILKYSIIVLVIAIVGLSAWFGSSIVGSIDKAFHGNVFSDVHALISGSTLNESNGRINILLAGDSVDDPNHGGALLADSIMVISYDPSTKNGFLLSIPRDLWVNIPSLGHQKINAANTVTNFSEAGYPSGGIGQLQQIVQTDLGIPIDYEATIDYTALKDAVNTVGGITVDIQSSDPYGIYDSYTHLKLPNGEDTLTGQQALDLARSRGDGPGSYGIPDADFSRTQFQREMMVALMKKALSLGVLANPLKVTSLFSSLGNNITTNLSLGDVTTLLRLTGGVNLSSLQSTTYSYGGTNPLLVGYLAPNGEDALIPTLGIDDFANLQAYYQQLTSSNPIVQEGPSVTILNASSVVGLASREKTILEDQGFNVEVTADASTEYPASLIVDNTSGGKPAAATQLKKDIKGQSVTSTSGSAEAGEATNYSSDFVVVLGQDWDQTGATGQPVQN